MSDYCKVTNQKGVGRDGLYCEEFGHIKITCKPEDVVDQLLGAVKRLHMRRGRIKHLRSRDSRPLTPQDAQCKCIRPDTTGSALPVTSYTNPLITVLGPERSIPAVPPQCGGTGHCCERSRRTTLQRHWKTTTTLRQRGEANEPPGRD
jgi:hypothetical protein